MKKTLVTIVLLCALIGQQVVTAQDWAAYDPFEAVMCSQGWFAASPDNLTDVAPCQSQSAWAMMGLLDPLDLGDLLDLPLSPFMRKQFESMDLVLYPFRAERFQSAEADYFCQASPWRPMLLYGLSNFFFQYFFIKERNLQPYVAFSDVCVGTLGGMLFFGLRHVWQCSDLWIPQGEFFAFKVLSASLNMMMSVFVHASLGAFMTNAIADTIKWPALSIWGTAEGLLRGVVVWIDWETEGCLESAGHSIEPLLYGFFLTRLVFEGAFQVHVRPTPLPPHTSMGLLSIKIPLLLAHGVVSSILGALLAKVIREMGAEAIGFVGELLFLGGLTWMQWCFAGQVLKMYPDYMGLGGL